MWQPHLACAVHQRDAGDLQRLPAVAHLAVQRHHVAGPALAVCTPAVCRRTTHSPCSRCRRLCVRELSSNTQSSYLLFYCIPPPLLQWLTGDRE